MAKIKIKPHKNKSFPPSAALSAASPKDVNVMKKNVNSLLAKRDAAMKDRGSKGALGSK
ncbi:hypothetical protein N1032_23425 [Herbiconiux sp. CPCC 203386]|uniref:Uncharacterized protein n=2 Tax=Herbiconiux daphne TaxID=2970914 RepID=A0ABT2H9P2_9MICO|nr:hypothetical protein [Herbiconiux daphne]